MAAIVGTAAGVALALWKPLATDVDIQLEPFDLDPQLTVLPGSSAPKVPQQPVVDIMAADPRSLDGIPAYPGASPRRILSSPPEAEQMMAISWFITDDSLESVLTFYEEAFARGDLLYTSHRFNERRGYVSWFESDPSDVDQFVDRKGVMHMVFASREGRRTTVLISATEPKKILEKVAPLPEGVRIPLGATPQVINLGEFGLQHAAIFASYEMETDQLLKSLQALWKETGWRVVDRAETESGASLVAVLDRRRQSAVIHGHGAQAQLMITLEEQPDSAGAQP